MQMQDPPTGQFASDYVHWRLFRDRVQVTSSDSSSGGQGQHFAVLVDLCQISQGGCIKLSNSWMQHAERVTPESKTAKGSSTAAIVLWSGSIS